MRRPPRDVFVANVWCNPCLLDCEQDGCFAGRVLEARFATEAEARAWIDRTFMHPDHRWSLWQQGTDPETTVTGPGRYRVHTPAPPAPRAEPCPTCAGSGACPACSGAGAVSIINLDGGGGA